MIFTRTMQLLQKEIMARFDVSSTIRHKGEKGRQREDGYAMFLREYLPERYGVATGEIIPYTGDTPSPQCDVIVYDRLSFPVIGKGTAVQQVPLEAVYAVTEMRTRLDKAAIQDARTKFDAIRGLPRLQGKDQPEGASEGVPFFVLFGYRLGTSISACSDLVRNAPNQDTLVVALDSGVFAWTKLPKKELGVVFFGAKNVPDGSAGNALCLALAVQIQWLSKINLGAHADLSLYLTP